MKKISLLTVLALMLGLGTLFAQDSEVNDSAITENEQAVEAKADGKVSNLTVSDSALCTAISDRMPEGKADEFDKNSVTKIYFWTKIEGATENTSIKHVWYLGETVIGEISLNVNSPSYRTWSSKTIYPGLQGDMSVAVLDAEGNELVKKTFKVK